MRQKRPQDNTLLSIMVQLIKGDCPEEMKKIPDGSVDLILCDPPYGTIKGLSVKGWEDTNAKTGWDEVIDTTEMFVAYERILRMNGRVILFSQEPYTSLLRTHHNESIKFTDPMIWKKNHFANGLMAKKAPVSYFEDISVFIKKYDTNGLHPLRKYFKDVLDFIGAKSGNDISKALGHGRADHCFRVTGKGNGSMQFSLCTEATYNELISVFGIDKMEGFAPYKTLRDIN